MLVSCVTAAPWGAVDGKRATGFEMHTVFRLTRIGLFDVALWLHTKEDPTDSEWDQGCDELSALKQRSGGDASRLRTVILSDGGAPNARQRSKFSGLFTGPTKSSLITVSLTNPVKRAIANLITTWLNPGFRAFGPPRTSEALTYVELLSEQAAIWKHFDELANILGMTETLLLARKAATTADT